MFGVLTEAKTPEGLPDTLLAEAHLSLQVLDCFPYGAVLTIKTETWPIDSRGLLNHGSRALYSKTFRVRTLSDDGFVLHKLGCDTELLACSPDANPVMLQWETLLYIRFEQDRFYGYIPIHDFEEVQLSTEFCDFAAGVAFSSQNDIGLSPSRLAENRALLPEPAGLYSLQLLAAQKDMQEIRAENPLEPQFEHGVTWKYVREPHALKVGDILRFGSYRLRVNEIVLTVEDVAACFSCPIKGTEVSRSGIAQEVPIVTEELQRCHKRMLKKKYAERVEAATSQEEMSSVSSGTVKGSLCSSDNLAIVSCRICFEQAKDGDPLIAPCNCIGSVKYIHISCLNTWIQGQLQIRNNEYVASYFLRPIQCELCKNEYISISYTSTLIPRPNFPHLVLQEFPPNNGSSKAEGCHFYVVNLQRSPVQVGRSRDSGLLLTDVSASRNHAVFKVVKDSVVVQDTGSKFGSLVAIPGRFEIPVGRPVSVQLGGNSLVTLSVCSGSPPFAFRLPKVFPHGGLMFLDQIECVKDVKPTLQILEKERDRRSRQGARRWNQSPGGFHNLSAAATQFGMENVNLQIFQLLQEEVRRGTQINIQTALDMFRLHVDQDVNAVGEVTDGQTSSPGSRL